MGTLWPKEEYMIRSVIKTFRKNKITIFPQTVYYDEKTKNQRDLWKIQKFVLVFKRNSFVQFDKRNITQCKYFSMSGHGIAS